MDEILKNIFDGNREKALKLLSESEYDLPHLFESIDEDEKLDAYEMVIMTRVAIKTGYISFNPANLRGY